MRERNGELMRRYMAAWDTGDTATLGSIYADGVVMHIPGRSAHAGTYRGRDAVFAAIGRIVADADGGADIVDVHDLLVSDEHAVALVRERFARGGQEVVTDRVVVYHVDGQHITEIWTYDSDVYAYDALFPGSAAEPG